MKILMLYANDATTMLIYFFCNLNAFSIKQAQGTAQQQQRAGTSHNNCLNMPIRGLRGMSLIFSLLSKNIEKINAFYCIFLHITTAQHNNGNTTTASLSHNRGM